MRILVVGAGALGSSLTLFLKNAGHEVWIQDIHKRKLEQIQDHGLILYLPNHHKLRAGVLIASSYQPMEKPDMILMTVKSYQVSEALEKLRKRWKDFPPVVFFQNGVTALEKARESLPSEKIFAGIYSHAVMTVSLFETRFGEGVPEIFIGRADGKMDPVMEEFASVLNEAGPGSCAQVSGEEFQFRLWENLMLMSCIEPVCALGSCHLRDALSSSHYRECIRHLAEESLALAKAFGVSQTERFGLFKKLDSLSGLSRFPMTQDLEARRKSEIDDLNGWMIQQAAEKQTPHSWQECFYLMVKAREESFLKRV